VGKALGWKRARWKPISLFFKEEKATEAVLDVLRHTEIGKMRRAEVPVGEDAGGSDQQ
jgi:hypothetical protein